MLKFITRILAIFSIVIVLLILYSWAVDVLSSKIFGINTQQQIAQSFDNAVRSSANCFFLGNSRIYRGINPDAITQSRVYNFAHDNDSYNQMYYKLMYLDDHKCNIDTLIIGTDYFQFGVLSASRNYVYDKFFAKEYIYDYSSNTITENLSNLKQVFINKQPILFQCIKKLISNNFKSPNQLPFLKSNGQYVFYGQANEDDCVKRDNNIDSIQYAYFNKIIEYCKRNDIELFVIMLPVRDNELSSYSSDYTDSFNSMIEEAISPNYSGHYYNFSNLNEFKDYRNYTDITHLKQEAADRFTVYCWNTILHSHKEI